MVWEEGYGAGLALGTARCPYPADSYEACSWHAGFIEGCAIGRAMRHELVAEEQDLRVQRTPADRPPVGCGARDGLPVGCEPERWLTDAEADALFSEIRAISDNMPVTGAGRPEEQIRSSLPEEKNRI